MRILVVEDNPANQLLAETVLEREGYAVEAGSAVESDPSQNAFQSWR